MATEEEFDEFNIMRKDLGSLLKSLVNCCGANLIFPQIKSKFAAAVEQKNLGQIEAQLFCVVELSKTLGKMEDYLLFTDILALVLQFSANEFVALRLCATELIISIARLLGKQQSSQEKKAQV